MSSFKKPVLALFIVAALAGVAFGAVCNVGDSAGWTMMGVDYNNWASTKTFRVGDSLVFKYDSDFHDLRQVTHDQFLTCNSSSPIASYESGSETIALKSPGHYYFLCRYPGHCEAGQKLDVLVTPSSFGPVPSPALTSIGPQPQVSVALSSPAPAAQPVAAPSLSTVRSSSASSRWSMMMMMMLMMRYHIMMMMQHDDDDDDVRYQI